MTNIELYISLSSIPGREKYLIDTLKSLVNQKVKPKMIFINLCNKYKRFNGETYSYKYINKFKKFFKDNRNLIKIVYVDDYGPITKLFGCLQHVRKNSNIQYITVLDDDLIYSDLMIEQIIDNIKKDSFKSYSYCVDNIDGINVGKGADSFSIKLNSLDKIREYYDIIIKDNELWFYHDDFIISSYLYLKNINIENLRNKYNLKKTIYTLSPNMSKRALHKLQNEKSPENLNKVLRKSFNKLLDNGNFNKIKIDK
mgnify:CR=1 FL=1